MTVLLLLLFIIIIIIIIIFLMTYFNVKINRDKLHNEIQNIKYVE